ncbi:MAG: molybdenum ABC transporter ATP-binding protein [Alphaproteobacteria bacterium TMED87]|nr:molybdenum ABC transporter ATP-binding protein [Rhodospirillaceae bacterium]OUV11895.1 MAG: molybdenum ABC transporter ATP-binding protein [Alphaproteobacteria bacterium TMED87]
MLLVKTEFKYKDSSKDFKLSASFKTSSKGVTAIYGPSGSGKTTLFRIISGLIKGSEELITLNNEIICNSKDNKWTPPHERGIGYVFQDVRLFPHLNVKNNLTFVSKLKKKSNLETISINTIVESLNIEKLLYKKVHHLSGGEKKLVAIGRALMMKPKILLLDEPLGGLDVERKRNIIPYLDELCTNLNIPILYISHNINEIKKLANWIITMKDGKVNSFGSIEEVTGRIDLSHITEGKKTKTILKTKIINHEQENNLTILEIGNQKLSIPLINKEINSLVKIEIRPQDVGVALSKPKDVSFLNILLGTVSVIISNENNTYIDIQINVGSEEKPKFIWSKITKFAERNLKIKKGNSVYILLKTMSIKINNTSIKKIINSH